MIQKSIAKILKTKRNQLLIIKLFYYYDVATMVILAGLIATLEKEKNETI